MKKHTAFLFLFFTLFFVYPHHPLHAHWNNIIYNYKKNTYGGAPQIWQISSSEREEWTYFANKSGLLQFDRNEWRVFSLHNGLDVRSVYYSQNLKRIYFGGIHEFGYLETNNHGEINYICLSDSLNHSERNIGNIWGIFESENILYWQGDEKIIKQQNGKLTTINLNEKIDCSALIDNVLYIGTTNGVKLLIGNTFYPIQGNKLIETKRIRGFIPYNGGILIATAYNGLFYYNGYSVKPFITGLEQFIYKNEIFTISSHDTKIAIGTVHKGIVLFDTSTATARYFNESTGLQNNTVLSLSFDADGNLWAGLNDGIDYINLNFPYTNLYTYPNSLGSGYCSILNNNKFYFGTNRGLYATDYPVDSKGEPLSATIIPNTSGQVWNLRQIGNDLFCAHDRGIFLINGTNAHKIGEINGVWDCKPLYPGSNKILLGTYNGLYLMDKKNDKWTIIKHLNGFHDSIENFEIENGCIIWTHNNIEGIIKLELDTITYDLKEHKNYNVDKKIFSNKDNYVNTINNMVFFTTPNGVYQYDDKADSLISCDSLNTILNATTPYYRLFGYNKALIAINEYSLDIINKDSSGNNIHELYSLEQCPIDILKNFKEIVFLDDSLLIIPNENGFAMLNRNKKIVEDNKSRVHIKYVSLTYPKDTLIYHDNFLNKRYIPEISYKNRYLRIEYDFYSLIQSKYIKYRYRIKEDQKWSEYTSTKTKEYSNLTEGTYTFQVEAVTLSGNVSYDEFTFTILPPWYRTSLAYFVYALLFILLIWLIYKWDDHRLTRKKRMAIKEKEKEMAIIEQQFQEENTRKEQQIIQLEKEKLEYELKHKSQEITNLMITSMRKNEILTEIKQELFKVVSKMSGEQYSSLKKMLLIINNRIDSNIQSDDTLKRIEEEFDLVHNNFIKKLSEKHPELSLTEKMMCTYLKMNLSSKEIAPLLNLSTRGVETVRYRLRKKLGLEREDNLIMYLENINMGN